jgi:hypothetical protein
MFCKVAIGVAAARIAARRSVIDDLPSHGDAVLLGMAGTQELRVARAGLGESWVSFTGKG